MWYIFRTVYLLISFDVLQESPRVGIRPSRSYAGEDKMVAIAAMLLFTVMLKSRAKEVAESGQRNQQFDCRLDFRYPEGEENATLEVLQKLPIVYDNRTCSSKPFYLGYPKAAIREFSCTGTSVFSLKGLVTEEISIPDFWVGCATDFPVDLRADGELSFKWRARFYPGYTKRLFGATIRGTAVVHDEWSTSHNSTWSLSNNYTIYSISDQNVSITVELSITSAASRSPDDLSAHGKGARIHVEVRGLTLVCIANFSGPHRGFMAHTTGTNPTETRMMRTCLKSKKLGCVQKLDTEFWREGLGILKLLLVQPQGGVYCKIGEAETFVEYFSPINKMTYYTNMSLIWQDDNVLHIQIDDRLDTLVVEIVNKSSWFNPIFSNEPTHSTKLLESEYLDLECHYVQYVLEAPIWLAVYANKTEQIPTDNIKTEKHHARDGTWPIMPYMKTSEVLSSHSRIQGKVGMIAIECRANYWNKARYASATYNVKIKSISETVPPAFNKNVSSHAATVGSSLRLNCSADYGDPKPEYTWMFDATGREKNIRNTSNETGSSYDLPAGIDERKNGKNGSTLEIHGFRLDMEGTYICVAKNIRANASRRFEVELHKEPTSWNTAIYLSACFAVITVLGITLIVICRKFYTQRGRLTSMEIKLFDKGNAKELNSDNFGNENAQFMPYNRDYEIKWSDFKLFDDEKLGQGEYGVVFKGCLATNTRRAIAVKTVKSGAEKSIILALLSELKVMIHLGEHENVVRLIGACTTFLKEGRVYVLIEFCPLGSLESFLRKSDRNQFGKGQSSNDYANTTEVADLDYDLVDGLTAKDLLGWAIQIARGMQYLESRKVIHGDLATRNVLLMSKAYAKITDFGLSRQLMNYDNYVKKSQCKLPWRWLALESLKSLVFTHKSDVWSYGITLWEIYSLGLVPYTGMAWTTEFVNHLEDDLRLHKPKFAPDYIYKIMTSCWDAEPGNRPDFQQLEQALLSCKA